MPDVWTVDVELPAAWTGSSKSSDAEAYGSRALELSGSGRYSGVQAVAS